MITQERLKKVLNYNPGTGDFTWVSSIGPIKSGSKAGTEKGGYINIQIDKKLYKAHRLAWLYINGAFPDNIDHINHIGIDNRILNLRDISHADNMRNRSLSSNNKSGVNGVFFYKRDSLWVAQIEIHRKNIFLGRFNDKFDAICARKSADNKYGFHENHGITP